MQYTLKPSKYSSHYFLRKLVGIGNTVLDIGCGEGYFASTIAYGNKVVGIDVLSEPINIDSFERFIRANLENGLEENVIDLLEGQKFDKILLADILEHLCLPQFLLQDCHLLLKPQADLLVSLPNVANITVRIALLFGRWNYTDRGILDKTHYRFYTRHSARSLLEENGYYIVKQMMTVMPIELVIGLSPQNPLMRLLNSVLAFFTTLMPGLLGYQCIFVARAKNRPPSAL